MSRNSDLNMSPEKKEKLKMSSSKKLSEYLKKYQVKFSKSLDDIWEETDIDNNGYLDRSEAKEFLNKVTGVIEEERAKNYNLDEFEDLFDQYDEDDNGYLSKMEMS